MRMFLPLTLGGISFRGEQVVLEDDRSFEVADPTPEEISEMLAHGVTLTPPDEPENTVEEKELDEKDKLIAALTELGVQASKRKPVAYLRKTLDRALEAKRQAEEDAKNKAPADDPKTDGDDPKDDDTKDDDQSGDDTKGDDTVTGAQ